jgi:hypothetical protein
MGSHFSELLKNAHDQDDRLRAILRFCASMEVSHFLGDRNNRTFMTVYLTAMPHRFGFPPSVLPIVNGMAFFVLSDSMRDPNMSASLAYLKEGMWWHAVNIEV